MLAMLELAVGTVAASGFPPAAVVARLLTTTRDLLDRGSGIDFAHDHGTKVLDVSDVGVQPVQGRPIQRDWVDYRSRRSPR